MRPPSHRYPHVGLVFGEAAELACSLIGIIEHGDSDVVGIIVVVDLDVVVFFGVHSDDVGHWNMLS